jgi:putative transposase
VGRIARVEAVGAPHHVIQRGNRRQNVFLREGDKAEYLRILALQSKIFDMHVWAYCLMDNHIHLIVVPCRKGSLAEAIGETHKLYTRMINFREGWRGYLWQGRFKSFPLDEKYLYAVVRYVERNPVRAKITTSAQDYPWSSARAHVLDADTEVLARFYLQDEIKGWSEYLSDADGEDNLKLVRRHILTGRPLGEEVFVKRLEEQLGRRLTRQRPGPKR